MHNNNRLCSTGTFDVTNASVSTNSTNGKVKVSCGFIEGSEAAGVLIIAYSTSDPSDIHYQVIPRNGKQSVETVLSCLPGETYNVLLFVISKDGLPLSFPATQLFPTSINHGSESNVDTNGCKFTPVPTMLFSKICFSKISIPRNSQEL